MPEQNVVPMLTYDQARDVYEKARLSPLFQDMSLPKFSATANEITGTQQFAMGLSDNVLKQLNYKMNQASTAVANMAGLGSLGAGAMEMVGLPQHADVGRRIGEMLPRGVAETAMLFAGGGTTAAARAAGWGARLLGAGSQGAQAYSATDSPAAGGFTGLTSLAMPRVVQGAHALVPKLFGKSLGLVQAPASAVTGVGTSQTPMWTAMASLGGAQGPAGRVAQKTLETTARNLAFMGFGEGQLQGSQLLATGQLMPYTDEHVIELVAGQLAFAPLDILGITRPRVKTSTEQIVAQEVVQQRGALQQRIDAAVDEVKRGGPLGTRTEELVATLDKVEQDAVMRSVGMARSKVTRALQSQTPFELDEVTMFPNVHGGKSPLRGRAAQAVQATIDDLIAQGYVKLDGTKVVPVVKFDLKGQLNLLDATGEAKVQARVQREQQAQVAAAVVLEMEVVPKGETKGALVESETQIQTDETQPLNVRMRGWENKPVVFVSDRGERVLVSRTTAPGVYDQDRHQVELPWRVTYFDENGQPTGHNTHQTWVAAVGDVGNVGPMSPLHGRNWTWQPKFSAKSKPEAKGALITPEQTAADLEKVGHVPDLQPALPRPVDAATSTAQRAWQILSTLGGADTFAKEMSRNDPEGRQYTAMEARQALIGYSRNFIQEVWGTVSAEAKVELERMSQLARATAEPVGKPVMKKPLETELAKPRDEAYKGPGLSKEVTELPQVDTTDFASVKDLPSAQAWLADFWSSIWRKVQGYDKRQVTKKVDVESPTGEVTTKPVTTTDNVLARKPGTENVNLQSIHKLGIELAVKRLKQLGIEATPKDFAEPAVPDYLAQAIGWDKVKPSEVTIAGRMQQLVRMIGEWYGIKADRVEDLVTDPKTMVEPNMQQQIELADARIEQQLKEAYRLAEVDPGLKNSLWQAEAEWQSTMDQITSVRREAVPMLTMVRNAMLKRVEALDKVLTQRSEELVARAVARMAKTSLNYASKELGVPQARMDEVMQIVDEYDRATVQRVQVKDADGKQIIKTTRGPIVQELMRVMYNDEIIKRTMKGGQPYKGTPSNMLNTLAAYRLVEWSARVIQGLKAEEDVMAGRPTKLPPEANLFTRYLALIREERAKKGKPYNPATREELVHDVAREALFDLVMIPQRKKSKYGDKSPAWERYDVEGKTKWWQSDSDAYALAMADTEHAMSGSEAETFDAVSAYDQAAFEAATAGKGGPIAAGTEMDTFFRRAAQRLASGFRFTAEMIKGLDLAQVVFKEDYTLDREGTKTSVVKRSLSTEQTQTMAKALNATLDILAEPEQWGFQVRQDAVQMAKGQKYKMSLELVPRTLENGRSEGFVAAMWRVINKVGKVSPELRATHDFLVRDDTSIADVVQTAREVWQAEGATAEGMLTAVMPLRTVLSDNAVARAVGTERKAGQALGEAEKNAVRQAFQAEFKADWQRFVGEKGTSRWFFKKYVDKLQSDYSNGVESSYKNWRQNDLPRALEAVAALELNAGKKEAKGAQIADETSPQADESAAARELLNTVTTDQQVTAGLWAHFQTHFSRMGFESRQAGFYADIAARIGAAFPKLQQGTVVSLVDPRFAGVYVARASEKYLIGLSEARFAKLPPGEKAAMMFHFAAHELAHRLYSPHNETLTAEQILVKQNTMLWAQSLGEAGRRAVLKQSFDAVLPILHKHDLEAMRLTRLAQGGEDPVEFVMDLTALSVLGLASPDPAARQAVMAHYLMSDAHVQAVLQSTFVPLLDVTTPLAEYMVTKLPNAEMATYFKKIVDGTREVLNTTTDKIDKEVNRLYQLYQAEPALFYDAVGKGYKPEIELLGPDDTQVFKHAADMVAGKSETAGAAIVDAAKAMWGFGNAYTEAGGGKEVAMPVRWFFTAGQLAQKYPVLRPMFQLAFRYFGEANAAAQKIMGHMLRKRPWLGTETLDAEMTGFKRVLANANAREAFDDIGLMKQGSVEAGEARRVLTNDEMVAVAERHGVRNKEDQLAIINLHRNFEIAAPKIREHTINMLVKTLSVRMIGAKLMQLDPTLSPDVAIARAHTLGDQTWQAVLAGQEPAFTDAAMLDAVKPLQAALAPLKKFADDTATNPEAWMPEVRIGRWKIAYWEKGADGKWRGGVQAAASKAERDAKIEALKKREAADRQHADAGQVVGVTPWDAWTKREDTNQGQPMWRLLHEMATGSLQKRLIDAGVTDPALHAKIFDANWSPVTSAMEAAEARDVQRMTKQRQLRPGRETLNMAQGFLHQANHIPRALSQMYTDAEASIRLDAPELRGEGALRELARKHYRNVVHPQAAELTSLKKFIFAYFMGFNISSILIEPTQQVIALLPSLTRDTGSISGSMKMWTKAAGLCLNKAMRKGVSGDADLDAALAQADKDQITSFGIMQELYNAEDYGALNVASALSAGRPLWNAKRLATSAFNAYVNSARRFYSVAPMVNNVLGFASAYVTARDHGVFVPGTGKLQKLQGKAAYDYAAGVTQAAMGGGGIAGRPVELFHGMGKATGVVGAMYSLATYSMLMMSHVARLGLDSIGGSKDLTPMERRAAQKALGQTLMTQMAFAGALGLPMATGVLAVLEQVFPGLKANEAVQDTVQQLVGEDDDMGGFFTDLVMRGVPNALLGVDTSSRLQLSNVLGVSQYDGFKVENLLGPTGSIIGNAFRATQDVQKGKIVDGVERLLPTAFKNIAQLYRDNWTVRDWKGQPLYEPTGGELALQMMGLRPNAVTKLRDAQKMAKRSTEVARAEGGQFTDKLAQWLVDGEVQKVQEALLHREKTLAGYSAVEGARTVADKATKMLFPLDFAREGVRVDAPTRQKLALSGGVRQTPETQWLQTKKRLEGLLGIPGGGQMSRSELMMAQLVDQLRAQNPLLSVQEAREQAQIALGRGTPHGLQVPFGQTGAGL